MVLFRNSEGLMSYIVLIFIFQSLNVNCRGSSYVDTSFIAVVRVDFVLFFVCSYEGCQCRLLVLGI